MKGDNLAISAQDARKVPADVLPSNRCCWQLFVTNYAQLLLRYGALLISRIGAGQQLLCISPHQKQPATKAKLSCESTVRAARTT